jgi:hypothetical protein
VPPGAAALLDLQRTAGNQAVVARVLGRPALIVQRRRKGKQPPPKWVTDAARELQAMFPNDPLISKVVIKDYAKLNRKLRGASFDAWTNSRTEIYLRDLAKYADKRQPKTVNWPLYMMRYVLRHEAQHIREFDKTGGPPRTWEAMLLHEQVTYTDDKAWLGTAGAATLIPDPDLRTMLEQSAEHALAAIHAALQAGIDTRGNAAAKEAARLKSMKQTTMIPAGAGLDPTKLYVQPKP